MAVNIEKARKTKKLEEFMAYSGQTLPVLKDWICQDTSYRAALTECFGEEMDWSKPDLDLVFIGKLGAAGTAFLGKYCSETLGRRFSTLYLLQGCELERERIYPNPELLKDCGVCAVYPLGEGGMYRTLFDLWLDTKAGFRIDYPGVLVDQITIEFCEVYDLDPWELYSGGSMILVTEHGNQTLRKLKKEGINGAVIGYTAGDKDKRICHREGESLLNRPRPDALLTVLKSELPDGETA